jgi:hypothetical protein
MIAAVPFPLYRHTMPHSREVAPPVRIRGPGLRSRTMKTVVAILTLALFAIGPIAAESATLVPPGHHAKGTNGQPGASYYAPGHKKTPTHAECAWCEPYEEILITS